MVDNFSIQVMVRNYWRGGSFFWLLTILISLFVLSGCAWFSTPGPNSNNTTALERATLYLKASKSMEAKPDDETKPISKATKDENNEELTLAECVELDLEPRIHSIGTSRILTFEPIDEQDKKHKPRVEIIVEGRDLHVPPCVKAIVNVGGTVEAQHGVDFVYPEQISSTGSSFKIVLTESYLKRLKSGDQVEVWIAVDSLFVLDDPKKAKKSTRAYAHRRFTIYTVDDYRNMVLANRVRAHNLNAFPLSMEDIQMLFGPIIAENFFVVKLSIRNDKNVDKLISTGMIVASGRLIVEPRKNGSVFTIPIEIAPQSLEQVYTILDDEEVRRARPRVFRGLEFIGSLASAINATFGNKADLTKALSLFTGVFIPGGKELWPDRHPRYERNIVSFAMQDLMKVPRGSVMNQKYIFFSKNKIDGIINDPNIFGNTFSRKGGRAGIRWWNPNMPPQPEPPDAAIIYVAFDNLDIPFENVFAVETKTMQEKLNEAGLSLDSLNEKLNSVRDTWKGQPSDILLGTLRMDDFGTAATKLASAIEDLKEVKSTAKNTHDIFTEAKEVSGKLLEVVRAALESYRSLSVSVNNESLKKIMDGAASNEFDTTINKIKDMVKVQQIDSDFKKTLKEQFRLLAEQKVELEPALKELQKIAPFISTAQTWLKSLGNIDKSLRGAEGVLRNIQNFISNQLQNSQNLPGSLTDKLKAAKQKLGKTLELLEKTLKELEVPFKLAKDEGLPLNAAALEEDNNELNKVLTSLGEANTAINEILDLPKTSGDESIISVKNIKDGLKLHLEKFPPDFLSENANLSKLIGQIPDAKSLLDKAHTALEKAEELIIKVTAKIEEASIIPANAQTIGSLIDEISNLSEVADTLTPESINANLVNNGIYGVDALASHKRQVDTIRKGLTRGVSSDAYDTEIASMEEVIDKCKMALGFYKLAAGFMDSASKDEPSDILGAQLNDFSDQTKTYKQKEIEGYIESIKKKYTDPLHDNHKGLNIVTVFTKSKQEQRVKPSYFN